MATPYLGLDLPVVTVTLGPEWATKLNAALNVVDDHDHTAGKGRPITSAALNINDDVSIGGYNLRNARSYNMQNLGSPIAGATDVRSVYSVAGELWYNDGVGNQIQLTAGGALNAASVGGIGGDYATSSANVYYSSISKTFTFDQNTNQRAKLAVGDLLISDTSTVSPNAITLKSPTSLAASYQLRLPNALPLSTLPLVVSSSGDIDPGLIVDAMIDVNAVTNTKIQDGAVTTTKIADDNVTQAKLATAAINDSIQRTTITNGSGNFTVPASVTRIWGTIIGAGGSGGGGGGGNNGVGNSGSGGGGGAAGEQIDFVFNVTPAQSIPYVIGVGPAGGVGGGTGVNGSPGSNGAATYFYRLRAKGGERGTGGLFAGAAGSGGVGISGSANGGDGGQGTGLGANGGISDAITDSGSGGTGGGVTSPGVEGGGGGGGGAPSKLGGGGNGQNGMSSVSNTIVGLAANGTLGSGGGGGGGARSNIAADAGGAGAFGGNGVLEIFYVLS